MDEKERLELNHRLQSTILEPRHTEIIVEKLANVHSQGRRSRVLDVGAQGTGAFAFALANAQPFADITAIDIDWSNFVNARSHHGNVDLQTVDLTQPLPFESGYFDVIHLKSMHLSIPYYTTLVERLARVLSAGGLLVMAESEPTYLSTTGQPMHRSLRQWDAAVREAYAAQQIDVDLPSNLLSCLSTSAVFATPLYTQELGIPCGSYVRGLLASNMRSMMPVLMAYGYAREDLERLVEDCVTLLSGPGSTFYQRLFAVYATKLR